MIIKELVSHRIRVCNKKFLDKDLADTSYQSNPSSHELLWKDMTYFYIFLYRFMLAD